MKHRRSYLFIIFTAAAALSLLSCGGSSSSPSNSSRTPPPAAPAAPTLALPNGTVFAFLGEAFSYDASQSGRTFRDANGDRLTYSITFEGETFGLAAEGSIISGTPEGIGDILATITADDGVSGTAVDSFTISIGNRPVIAAANEAQTARVAVPFSYDASQGGTTFSDPDGDALSYSVTLTPGGLGLTAQGSVISGTASLTGTVTAQITADDGRGGTVADSFDISILPRPVEQIIVTQEPGIINVFVKGSIETSNKYLRYQFQRFDNPDNRARGWGWRRLHEATITQNGDFIIGNSLINGGENILAIREVNKSDFMGGRQHGDALETQFTMLIDGEPRSINGISRFRGTRAEFLQDTTLYEVDSQTNIETAHASNSFKIEYGVTTLNNRVEFTRPIELSSTFMTMLSVERRLGDPGSPIVTSTGAWSPDFVPFDVSRDGHGAPRSFGAEEIRLTGPLGYSFGVKMTKGWDHPRRRSYITDDPNYNKLYFSPIGLYDTRGPGLQVPAGEVIEIEAEYRLDTAN